MSYPASRFILDATGLSVPDRDALLLGAVTSADELNSKNWHAIEYDVAGRRVVVTVLGDYLRLGVPGDALRPSLPARIAQRAVDRLDAALPTPYLVDRIMRAADVRLVGWPIGHGPEMESLAWIKRSHDHIETQLAAHDDTALMLIAGHKKDLVIPTKSGRVSIYGFCKVLAAEDGNPLAHAGPGYAYTWWQGYFNGHDAAWADYSQATRPVQRRVLVDGVAHDYVDLLADPATARLLTGTNGTVPAYHARYA